jgi:hypothetical protein
MSSRSCANHLRRVSYTYNFAGALSFARLAALAARIASLEQFLNYWKAYPQCWSQPRASKTVMVASTCALASSSASRVHTAVKTAPGHPPVHGLGGRGTIAIHRRTHELLRPREAGRSKDMHQQLREFEPKVSGTGGLKAALIHCHTTAEHPQTAVAIAQVLVQDSKLLGRLPALGLNRLDLADEVKGRLDIRG